MHQQLSAIIKEAIDELNSLRQDQPPVDFAEQTPLYGADSPLDSVDLVNLLIAIEEKLEDELDVNLVIANEKALSMKHSPFQSIRTLHDYLAEELNLTTPQSAL